MSADGDEGPRHSGVLRLLRRRLSQAASDCGSTAVEMAILIPVVMTLLFGGVQLTEWYTVRHAALAAAEAGARAASANGAPAGSGTTAANTYFASTGGTMSSASGSTEAVTATTVTVRVTATANLVIPLPGLSFTVDVSATRPRERFTP